MLAAVLLACSSALVGCSLLGRTIFGEEYVEFTQSMITLEVGDTCDLTNLIDSSSSSYSLTSSDKSVVTIKGRTATAVAEGTATVTAALDFYTAKLIVTVVSAEPVDDSVLSFEFDNQYPHFYVNYDLEGSAVVQITFPSGETQEYSQEDPRYSSLFDDKRFDAGEFVSACASSLVQSTYKFQVKSLGDGDELAESEYSESVEFKQLPYAARTYIQTIVGGRDLYITSEYEYAELAEYYIIFRDKSGRTPVKIEFDCYLGFNYFGKPADIWNKAFHVAATSGNYSDITVTRDGNVLHSSCKVDTVNNPSRYAVTALNKSKLPSQLHAILPHINFEESKYRADDHEFAIDKISRTESVEYSDELYLVAERGVRPIAKVGSSAAVIYSRAREILRKICTDDMTDIQKAHAIYDWIIWQVTYDTPATQIRNGEKYSAYYMEGVFGDGTLSIDGVKYPPYAVCDGMSKAYSLMCNIEGIPCVRVVGSAGSSLANAGGHAWNKVFVNGEWYIVDCTWGDSEGTLTLDGARQATYELGLHDHLFLTDDEVKGNHFEPYQSNDTTLVYAPKTTTQSYSVYEDMTVNGTAVNCFVARTENQLERTRQIATEFAKAYKKTTSITVPGCADNGVCQISYQGIDIKYESGITLSDRNLEAAVTSAIRSVLGIVSVKVAVTDDVAVVLIKN